MEPCGTSHNTGLKLDAQPTGVHYNQIGESSKFLKS